MSENIEKVYTANPITSNASTDLMYFGQSPYGAGNDAAMLYSNFAAQFGAPYTAAALTKTNDTNVTLTLGGTPATSLLEAVSLTLGWTGELSLARGGTNANLTASNGGIFYSTASAGAILAGTSTANQVLLSGSSTTPAWSTATYPSTTTINQILYSSSANVIGGISTLDNGVMITGSTGIPSLLANGTAGYALVANSGAPPSWQAVGGAYTASALTESNDTNVTLTLGGAPSTALLQAVSITAGWTGTLSLARGGTAANLTASNGGIFYSTASAGAILAGTATAGQLLTSGASTTPAWTTSTYPATNAANTLLYASSANTMAALSTANNSVLVTSSGGVPSLSTTLPSGLAATNLSLTTPTLGVAAATSINFGGSTLSTYQQGTFTPVLTSSGGGTATYNVQQGEYTQIGNIVFFQIFLNLTGLPSSGSLTITGLPSTAASYSACGITTASLGAAAITQIQAQVIGSSSTIGLYNYSAGAQNPLTVANCTSSSQFILGGHYFTS